MKRLHYLCLVVWLAVVTACATAPPPALATVTAQTPYIAYTGNGSTTVFAYPFRILANSDLVVRVAGVAKALTTDYTVTGAGNGSGGTVMFNGDKIPASGAKVELERNVPRDRTVDYQTAGPNFASTVNRDFDKTVMQMQDVGREVGRSIKAPPGAAATDTAINATDYEARAGKVLGWDAVGRLVIKAANFITSSGVIGNPWADARGYASIADAVAQLTGTDIELDISTVQPVAADLSVPASIRLVVHKGGALQVSSGKTLNIGTKPQAGEYQIFTGTGTVKFLPQAACEIPAAWFGPNGLAAAVGSISTTPYEGRGVVQLQEGVKHYLTDTLIVPDHVTIRGTGIHWKSAVICPTNDFGNVVNADYSHPLIVLGNPDHAGGVHWSFGARLENISIDGRGLVDTTVYSSSANENSGVISCWMYNMLKYGIWLDGSKYTNNPSVDPRLIHSEIRDCTVSFTDPVNGSSPYKGIIDTANAKGIYVLGSALLVGLEQNVTITKCTIGSGQGATGGAKPDSGIYITRTGMTSVQDCHVEYCVNGVVANDSNSTMIKNLDGHHSVTNLIKIMNSVTNFTAINMNKNGGTNIIVDETTDQVKTLTHDFIQIYSSGRNFFNEVYGIGSVKTNSTPGAYVSSYRMYGVDTSDGKDRLAGVVVVNANGDWTANADINYAPSKMFLGVGHASTTKTPFTDPSMQIEESKTVSWVDFHMRTGTVFKYDSRAFSNFSAVIPAAGTATYCSNCTTAAACASGGAGHLAISNGTRWTCQ